MGCITKTQRIKLRNVTKRQFYESGLTDHKTAFLFITKTHEKVHKNAWKKSTKTHRFENRRCGPADRWQ